MSVVQRVRATVDAIFGFSETKVRCKPEGEVTQANSMLKQIGTRANLKKFTRRLPIHDLPLLKSIQN
jgi:hypothetical protein